MTRTESAAQYALLEVARRILCRCERNSGTRSSYADGEQTLSGCSLTLTDIQAACEAIELATGEPCPMPK